MCHIQLILSSNHSLSLSLMHKQTHTQTLAFSQFANYFLIIVLLLSLSYFPPPPPPPPPPASLPLIIHRISTSLTCIVSTCIQPDRVVSLGEHVLQIQVVRHSAGTSQLLVLGKVWSHDTIKLIVFSKSCPHAGFTTLIKVGTVCTPHGHSDI